MLRCWKNECVQVHQVRHRRRRRCRQNLHVDFLHQQYFPYGQFRVPLFVINAFNFVLFVCSFSFMDLSGTKRNENLSFLFFWTILLFLEMADSMLIVFGVWNVTKIINLNLISANLR